jgi:hypothetical protein
VGKPARQVLTVVISAMFVTGVFLM